MYHPDRNKYDAKYRAEHYDRIQFRGPKGIREILTAAARKRGMSLQQFINSTLAAALKEDGVEYPTLNSDYINMTQEERNNSKRTSPENEF